jgi:ABC-type glycerol-3-phosphate transport system substrate-binding protein
MYPNILLATFLLASIAIGECGDVGSRLEGKPTPIVLWHGMGDTCCKGRMEKMKKLLEANIPGVHILSLKLGDNENMVGGIVDRFDCILGFFRSSARTTWPT